MNFDIDEIRVRHILGAALVVFLVKGILFNVQESSHAPPDAKWSFMDEIERQERQRVELDRMWRGIVMAVVVLLGVKGIVHFSEWWSIRQL